MHSPSCLSSGPRARRSAFTLIELLTVIAIIGILAAILIPTVGRVRSAARSITDLSSLREIGKACALFVNENKSAMPWAPYKGNSASGQIQAGELDTTVNGNGQSSMPVYESIDRYFTKKAGFNSNGRYQWNQRPTWFSAIAQVPDVSTIDALHPYGGYAQFSFNPNIWANSGKWRAKMNLIPAPSQTVLVGETNDSAGIGDSDLDPTATPETNPGVATKYRVSQPGGKAYYLWADFHVSALVGNQNFATNPTIWRWW